MTARPLHFSRAVPAANTALADRVGILRRTKVALRTELSELGLVSEPAPYLRGLFTLAMARAAIPVSSRRDPGVLRCPQVTRTARCPPSPFPFQVHRLGHRLQAGVRVAAQDIQAVVEMVEHQAGRNRTAEVLPGNPVNAPVPVIRRTAADTAVPRATCRAAPDPVAVNVGEFVKQPVDDWPSRVDPWHACSLYQALAIRKKSAMRHLLFLAVHDLGVPDPLSRRMT